MVTNDTSAAVPGCRSRFHASAPVRVLGRFPGRGQAASHP
ncbi:hypothetical protein MA5S0422_1083 [Mycobacteroides abscessus 5S-0422]|nr:hypothetical protein MA5S0421_1435 [Mycobacteroides abscessus 5S-0421]EIU18681.1 hypothetical protein MA5S0422_1083 [Mycobacteroides abscessus 5S-0422]EIU27534.1 hypothetical protein MA5S0817_1215 [Mycobacteroides abscessus 5S-0817]EIU27746.1 hypothetical protein MA5S0708_1660 [Mycobacteroides abscessus 5S-0708]EIU32981.1 hypothetical protein MA5S1212_1603 [Mycobacteroides abscessus 5S-1212]EIU45639.1 hypothetical protein MA5S1215_0917 [Mycobacteroides abscessus 5S-1215]EIU93853.1 hypothet